MKLEKGLEKKENFKLYNFWWRRKGERLEVVNLNHASFESRTVH